MSFFIKYGLIIGVLVFLVYCFKNKLHIDFMSFFKKGFKLRRDKYGCYCFTGKQGSR